MRHQECHNSTITARKSLKLEDIIKSHLQVQSKSDSGIVKNISYQEKVPFVVTKDLNHNAFEVKPHNWSNGDTQKYKAT